MGVGSLRGLRGVEVGGGGVGDGGAANWVGGGSLRGHRGSVGGVVGRGIAAIETALLQLKSTMSS